MSLKIIENYLTRNDCYKSGRTITPTCMQLHTIGTGQNTASSLASYWNQSGIQACVHYCIDAETEDLVLHFLPDNRRSWADGGYGNGHAITVELMESDYMKYSGNGASFTITNEAKFKADVTRAYNTAVKFFALKCKEYGWNPQEKMSNGLYRVFSHDEGRRLGLSTAHVDPTHIWGRYGWTMDKFRADVAKAMGKNIDATGVDAISSAAETVKYYRVRKTWEDADSQLGAYTSEENAKLNCPYGYKVFDASGKVVYENNTKPITKASGIPSSKDDYLKKVADIAVALYKDTRILPSVVTAQCCLETGFGLGTDTTELVKRNNLLGMKSDLINSTWKEYTVWDGTSFTKRTPEVYNGVLTYINDSFRVYKDYENCIRDYEMFLMHVKNNDGYKYRRVVGKTDPEEVITLISKGGYATDPSYITKIMKLIKEKNLTKYDIAAGVSPSEENLSIPTATLSYYRVAEDYKNGKYIGQIGAYTSRDNALASGKASNLNVYDASGKVIHQATKIANKAYRVRCGRFSVKQNATNLVNLLASNGIGSMLVKDGDEWDVQVGLFNVKENAEAYEKEIKNKGFDVMIVEIEG